MAKQANTPIVHMPFTAWAKKNKLVLDKKFMASIVTKMRIGKDGIATPSRHFTFNGEDIYLAKTFVFSLPAYIWTNLEGYTKIYNLGVAGLCADETFI